MTKHRSNEQRMQINRKLKEKLTHKIIVLGSGGVGKSAITIQFVKSFFFADYDPTIEDSYVKQCFVDDQLAHLEILDSAGQEEFKAMREQYIRVGEGFLLVFSLTDRRSLDECMKIYRDIIRLKETNNVPILLIGNKSDLRPIGIELQARDLALTMNVPFWQTSARTRQNVDQVFEELVRLIRKQKCQQFLEELEILRDQHAKSIQICTIL